jgi:hypothetical protein
MANADGTNMFIQYKGTDLCADLWCECGKHLHVDDYFAYAVQCPSCKAIYELPQLVTAVKVATTTFPVLVLDDED